MQFAHNVGSRESGEENAYRKIIEKPKCEAPSKAVFTWFLQKRVSGQTISGPLLCEKASRFNQKLGGESFLYQVLGG